MKLKDLIVDKSLQLGFELCGVARAMPVPDTERYQEWIQKGFAGTMSYLERGLEKRADPAKILPGVKSIICVGMNYYQKNSHPHISQYALGEDYHHVMLEKLKKLEAWIQSRFPQSHSKAYVDTGAILERSYAARAGLGWIGKNTCLINDGLGSFFFIGEILTTLEFSEEDYGLPALDQCGTCSKCLDACPTQAFVEPGVMDARKCISYLTIEYRGEFSEEQSSQVGGHVYGCDICQTVCPYNDRIPISYEKSFKLRSELKSLTLEKEISEEEFKKMTHQSAMDRLKYPQWKRNVAAVLKNNLK
ncbi:MAG: tRNA epoxyqueuosine(34) reductase QueG [Deltaproteobacteria bacterium]|nr:MAG: tRNA epoxyqueuosine(34) reductase QueG [Deltaproteobacteria bacterium]